MTTRNRVLQTALFCIPVVVALIFVIGDVLLELITGKPLFGIDAATGAMLIIVSGLTVPIGILLFVIPK